MNFHADNENLPAWWSAAMWTMLLNIHERLTQNRIIEIYAAAMDINLPLFNQCPCSKESLKLFRCEFISFEARLSVAMWCCLSCHAAGATRRFSCCVSFAAKFFVHCWCIKKKSSSIIKEWQKIVWLRPSHLGATVLFNIFRLAHGGEIEAESPLSHSWTSKMMSVEGRIFWADCRAQL